jgi:hypothetical protein
LKDFAFSTRGHVSKFRDAFNAGHSAVNRSIADAGVLRDAAGEDGERDRLRALKKWRFILVRGLLGWGIPMFLWLAFSNLPEDLRDARLWPQSTLQHLFRGWVTAFCMNAVVGVIIGFLAWRRLHSEVWPGTKPDPESSLTTLGALGPREP